MGELERGLGAALIPEPPGITVMDPKARPAASPLRPGLRLGLPRHKKTGGQGSKLCGVCASTNACGHRTEGRAVWMPPCSWPATADPLPSLRIGEESRAVCIP